MNDLSVQIKVAEDSQSLQKLITSVSAAIGTWFEANHLVRIARAEAKAMVLRAEADVRVKAIRQAARTVAKPAAPPLPSGNTSIAQRTKTRVAFQETRRQENVEAVVAKAVLSLPDEVSPEPVDPDWVNAFFTACQDVSNEQLQNLFARVLAGEIAGPSTISRRTLGVLRDLGPELAKHFRAVCAKAWEFNGSLGLPRVLDREASFADAVAPIEVLLPLQEVGLIHADPWRVKIKVGDKAAFADKEFTIRRAGPGMIELCLLSLVGRELYRATNAQPTAGFTKFALTVFRQMEIELEPRNEAASSES